jgi:hypothetical protein
VALATLTGAYLPTHSFDPFAPSAKTTKDNGAGPRAEQVKQMGSAIYVDIDCLRDIVVRQMPVD